MAISETIDADQLTGLLGYMVPSIDGTQVQNVAVMTNNRTDGLSFYVTDAQVFGTSVSGFVSAPSLNIGKTSPNFSDIASALALSNLNTSPAFIGWKAANGARQVIIAPGESLTIRIATAASATTYLMTLNVRGIYA